MGVAFLPSPHTEFQMRTRTTISLLAFVALAACAEQPVTAPNSADIARAREGKSPNVPDPTATWAFPMSDAALSIQSDHLYSDGTNSLYANGICNLTTTIFASATGSGDATLNTGATSNKCARRFRVVYPDGVAEVVPMFANLRGIANTTYSIPVGQTVRRQLHMGSEVWPNSVSRCGGLIWGYGVANNIAAGSDSVDVTRVDASTWHVTSQPAPRNLAYCKKNGELVSMSVEFTVVSSRAMN